MSAKTPTGFFAYPAEHRYVGEVILDTIENISRSSLVVTPWSSLNITGLKIDNLVRDRIDGVDVLIADITYPNFNVYYEIGYAIRRLKTVVPSINTSIESHRPNSSLIGFFDTVGQCRYSNSEGLRSELENIEQKEWISSSFKPRDYSHPLFILDTLVKSDFRNWIFQAAANSRVNQRTYDPEETPRLTAYNCIGDVAASAGVIVPILHADFADAYKHNLRAALIAGLAHGLERKTLILQWEDAPAPLDYRDFIETVRSRLETQSAVEKFCAEVLVENQRVSNPKATGRRGPLAEIDLGRSAAENEEETLEQYFVRTAQYVRISRSSSSIVIGRKGSGKSAIFTKLMQEKARDKRCLLVDLRPSSHNLSELREEIIDIVNVGVFDHTITAFWEYILYMEIVHRYRERVLSQWKNSTRVYRLLAEIEEKLGIDESAASGDFSSRLERLIRSVVREIRKQGNSAVEQLTNVVFRRQVPTVREIDSRIYLGV